jgi:hypothetical protein
MSLLPSNTFVNNNRSFYATANNSQQVITAGEFIAIASTNTAYQANVNTTGDGVSTGNVMVINNLSTGLKRWAITTVGAEQGANTGSDLQFISYSDAGNPLGRDITFRRSDGTTAFGDNRQIQISPSGTGANVANNVIVRAPAPTSNTLTAINASWTGTQSTGQANLALVSEVGNGPAVVQSYKVLRGDLGYLTETVVNESSTTVDAYKISASSNITGHPLGQVNFALPPVVANNSMIVPVVSQASYADVINGTALISTIGSAALFSRPHILMSVSWFGTNNDNANASSVTPNVVVDSNPQQAGVAAGIQQSAGDAYSLTQSFVLNQGVHYYPNSSTLVTSFVITGVSRNNFYSITILGLP